MKKLTVFILSGMSIFLISCKKENNSAPPNLIIKLKVDPNQARLNNIGQPATIPAGNAGQNPVFNKISSHYIELAQNAYTQLGQGEILYHAPETTAGGANAIDFSKSILKGSDEVFLKIPLSQVHAGTYQWVRVSLSYQNYDVQFYFNGSPFTGTIASFVGYNTYITNYKIKDQTQAVNANKLQGYWGFETNGFASTQSGQAPVTTVPNPLASTSPIPAGSCVVTGQFATPLTITGNETSDVTMTLSLSINKSFEWKDDNGNGKWDVTTNSLEQVVDMGLRGLVPSYVK